MELSNIVRWRDKDESGGENADLLKGGGLIDGVQLNNCEWGEHKIGKYDESSDCHIHRL
jgi:hypothetical protein